MIIKTKKKNKKPIIKQCKSSSKKSKAKKSTNKNECCSKCAKYNRDGKSCSIDGRDVEMDDVCKSFDGSITECCAKCGRKIQYKSREEYNNAVICFSMDSGSGSSSGQNIHLCKKCAFDAFNLFHDFLEEIRRF